MGDHAVGMDACIGAAGTVHEDIFSCHSVEETFNFTLYGTTVFLALPAAEFGAVVADYQFNIACFVGHCWDGDWQDGGMVQGNSGTMPRPAVSANPYMIFIF